MNDGKVRQRDRKMSHLPEIIQATFFMTSCMKRNRQNPGQYRQGATILEFAVVAPILFLCFLVKQTRILMDCAINCFSLIDWLHLIAKHECFVHEINSK